MKRCGQCQADNASNAKFCNQCGAALPEISTTSPIPSYTPPHLVEQVLKYRSALEGERKQVTVLFADMADSTRLADLVGAEDWHLLLDEFFSILSEEIHRFEGTINQFTGDGVMALFGAPIALEDHARRAAMAALALKSRLRDFAARLRREKGLNPATRMGLNSGEVVVGRIGDDLRMDYTAKGMTVNLASRMEQMAPPGRVYLTRYTADLLQDYFLLDPLGPVMVKGRDEPLEVFELRGETGVRLRLEASEARGFLGFAGREQELQTLFEAQRRAAAGQRQIVVLSGDAGLGKSRLCHEARLAWQEQGVEVLSCSGLPHGQAVPLQPIRDLLLQRFAVRSEDSPDLARQKIAGGLLMLDPDLRAELPLIFDFLNLGTAPASQDPLASEQREQRSRDLLARLCQHAGSQVRIVMVEDLHWLDEGSLDFLRVLLDCPQNSALMYLFNQRPGALPDWLQNLQPQCLNLGPLDDESTLGLARQWLGPAEELAQLAAGIARQANGNPFYVEEIVRDLRAKGRLQGEPGQYRLIGELKDIQIPPSVQAVIAARVDRLPEADKTLLQLAATLGQRFAEPWLIKAQSEDGDWVRAGLERLESEHYLERSNQKSRYWQFAHPLLQEVVYDSLLSRQRLALHAQIAERLAATPGAEHCQERAALLAHHFDRAQQTSAAAHWAMRAASLIARNDAAEELRYLRRAIQLLGDEPASEEDRNLAISARAAVLRLASIFPVPEDELEGFYQQAKDWAETGGHIEIEAELQISFGALALRRDNADKAVEHTGAAMRLAQSLPETELESRFRVPILFSYFAAGRLQEGLEVLDRRDGGAWHEGPIKEDNMMSRGFRALMLAMCGELARAETECRQALAKSEELGVSISWLQANLVDVLLLRGELKDGLGCALKARERAQEFGSPMFVEIAERAYAQALLAQGQAEPALKALQATLPLVEPGRLARQFAAAHQLLYAQALWSLGQTEDAKKTLDQALTLAEEAGQRLWALRIWLERARQATDLQGNAEPALAAAEALIEQTGARVFTGMIMELRAELADQTGNHQEAERYRLAAAQHWRQCGAEGRLRALPVPVHG